MWRVKSFRHCGAVAGIVSNFALFPATAVCEDMIGAWQTAPGWEQPFPTDVSNNGVPVDYDPLLLKLGRSVLVDLWKARRAVLDSEPTNLRVDLQQVRDTLRRLQQPAQAMALDAQMRVIRNDLRSRGKVLDGDLWVPVEAHIDEVRVYQPGADGAVGSATRSDLSRRSDVETPNLRYSLGLFPLHRVQQDVQAAWASASLPTPDWSGALEAVQRALMAFHWYTPVPAQALLAAYNDVANAYVLAIGPAARPDWDQKSLDYLVQAQRQLDGIAGGRPLAEETRTLIDKVEPSTDELRSLLDDIHSQIQHELQTAGAVRPGPLYDQRRMGP